MSTKQLNTYVSLTAGSTFIMPNGGVLRFMGPKGGHGHYSTSNPAEIEQLDELHASPTAQISRESIATVDEETAAVVNVKEETAVKALAPEVAQAAVDAAEASERAISPAVAAAQANLAKTISATTK